MRWLKILAGFVAVLGLALAVTVLSLRNPRPEGTAGPEAEALAHAIEAAAHVDAWNRDVGAITWNFGGRRDHLWDRTRSLARVRWGNVVALLDLSTSAAHITKAGARITGEEAQELRTEAYEAWANDSFWLNPLAKLFDAGTERRLVKAEDGTDALLVSYSSGGVTPGDAYLWLLGQDGLPRAWRMWVQIVPIGGMEVGWDDWVELPGGAKVSLRHTGPITLRLTEVSSATVATALNGGVDPFAPLLEAEAPPAAPASQPAGR
ncbi:MAG: hypothetical protein KC933_07215 [Myxococcales bacterium]|nr:hypothetical protein [Myxococcales bacterium]MCB9648230.1 hypothetical protein [Deltaproteobacteria bacterium]